MSCDDSTASFHTGQVVAAGNLCAYREKTINAAGAGSRSNWVSIGPQETSAPAQGLSGMGLGNNEG